jgi:hypothetical protein
LQVRYVLVEDQLPERLARMLKQLEEMRPEGGIEHPSMRAAYKSPLTREGGLGLADGTPAQLADQPNLPIVSPSRFLHELYAARW